MDFQFIEHKRIYAHPLLLGAWRCFAAAINVRGAAAHSSIDALFVITFASVTFEEDARTRHDRRALSRNSHCSYCALVVLGQHLLSTCCCNMFVHLLTDLNACWPRHIVHRNTKLLNRLISPLQIGQSRRSHHLRMEQWATGRDRAAAQRPRRQRTGEQVSQS
ncbi:MAG: hypothetical protein ACKPKO_33115, partial [Candidatus Fonsibacter sp.]